MANSAKTYGRPIYAVALCLVAGMIACTILLGMPALFSVMLAIPAFAALPMPTIQTLFSLATFGSLGLSALFAVHFCVLDISLGQRPLQRSAIGFALGVTGLASALALSALAGTAHAGTLAWAGLGLFALETALTVLQSGAEELYFRGWLQRALEREGAMLGALGGWLAVIVSALIFAALHFVAAAKDPLTFVTMFLGGMVFGLLYRKSDSLLLPWLAHFGWNWGEEMIFGLVPNPGPGDFGSLLDVDLAGSAWWGGSSEGLNASLGTVCVLLALLAAVIAWPSLRAPAPSPLSDGALRKNPARG